MVYIRKNVNLFLMFVIVLIVVSLAGLTSYYHSTYSNLSTSYDAKLAEVNKLIKDLNEQRSKLNQTTYELGLKEERESELSGQYQDVRKQYTSTKDELDKTKSDLESTKDTLASTEASLANAQGQIAALSATVSKLQSDVDDLKEDKEDLQDKINTICSVQPLPAGCS